MITVERFEEIFDETKSKWEGDNAYQGLQIISKYTDNLIQGASHDKIFSADLETLIEAGITEEDITKLGQLNWSIEHEYLMCFV